MGIDVAVNLLWCLPGRVGGSEEYLVRQMIGLSEIESPYSPVLYVLPGFAAAHPELASRFRLVVAPIDGTNRARRVLAEHGWLAEQTRASALVHHGGGTVPARGASPTRDCSSPSRTPSIAALWKAKSRSSGRKL